MSVVYIEQRAERPAVKTTGFAAGFTEVPDMVCRCPRNPAIAFGVGIALLYVTGILAYSSSMPRATGVVMGVAILLRMTVMSAGLTVSTWEI